MLSPSVIKLGLKIVFYSTVSYSETCANQNRFCNVIVCQAGQHENTVKLQAVQNFACKMVSGAQRYDHVTSILRQLEWLPVKNTCTIAIYLWHLNEWTALSQSMYLNVY